MILDNRFQRATDDNGAPRRGVGQGDAGKRRAVAVVLASLRKGDGVTRLSVVVAQVTADVTAIDANLADQHPGIVVIHGHTEQTWERIALPKA